MATVDEVNDRLVELIDGLSGPTGTEPVAPTTVADGATTTAAAPEVASGPALTTGPITTLTGGDPAAFCAVLADARIVLYGWTLALATEPADEAGQADLAFAPTLVRRLPAYLSSAPTELKARAQPVLDRARDALQVLRDAGVDDAGIDRAGRSGRAPAERGDRSGQRDAPCRTSRPRSPRRPAPIASPGWRRASPPRTRRRPISSTSALCRRPSPPRPGFDCLSAPAGLDRPHAGHHGSRRLSPRATPCA